MGTQRAGKREIIAKFQGVASPCIGTTLSPLVLVHPVSREWKGYWQR